MTCYLLLRNIPVFPTAFDTWRSRYNMNWHFSNRVKKCPSWESNPRLKLLMLCWLSYLLTTGWHYSIRQRFGNSIWLLIWNSSIEYISDNGAPLNDGFVELLVMAPLISSIDSTYLMTVYLQIHSLIGLHYLPYTSLSCFI